MKKWLNAIWVSRENIFKSWVGKVSYDVTDVSVPENTIFYFFSNEKVDMEMIQLSLTEQSDNLWIKLDGPVINNKIYCCGKKRKNDLVLIKSGQSNEEIVVKYFFDTLKTFKFEFV